MRVWVCVRVRACVCACVCACERVRVTDPLCCLPSRWFCFRWSLSVDCAMAPQICNPPPPARPPPDASFTHWRPPHPSPRPSPLRYRLPPWAGLARGHQRRTTRPPKPALDGSSWRQRTASNGCLRPRRRPRAVRRFEPRDSLHTRSRAFGLGSSPRAVGCDLADGLRLLLVPKRVVVDGALKRLLLLNLRRRSEDGVGRAVLSPTNLSHNFHTALPL